MQNLENNEFEVGDGAGVSKATFTPEYMEKTAAGEPTWPEKPKATKKNKPAINDLEASIIARSESLNIPALCAFFSVTEDVVKAALAKK